MVEKARQSFKNLWENYRKNIGDKLSSSAGLVTNPTLYPTPDITEACYFTFQERIYGTSRSQSLHAETEAPHTRKPEIPKNTVLAKHFVSLILFTYTS